MYSETLANGCGEEHIVKGNTNDNGQMLWVKKGVNGGEQWSIWCNTWSFKLNCQHLMILMCRHNQQAPSNIDKNSDFLT